MYGVQYILRTICATSRKYIILYDYLTTQLGTQSSAHIPLHHRVHVHSISKENFWKHRDIAKEKRSFP